MMSNSNNHSMTMNRALSLFARPAPFLALNLFAVIVSFTFGNIISSSLIFVEAFSAHHVFISSSSSSHRLQQHAVSTSRCSHDANSRQEVAGTVPGRYYGSWLRSSSLAASALPSTETNNTEEGEEKKGTEVAQTVARVETTPPRLTAEDKSFVSFLFNKKENSTSSVLGKGSNCDQFLSSLENAISDSLQDMSPGLLVALQMAAKAGEWKHAENENDSTTNTNTVDDADDDDAKHFETQMIQVGIALQNVLDARLRSGRSLLTELLNSGEIRKLDSLIGKAAREGKLDMSFFSVLSMNMQDAAIENSSNNNNNNNNNDNGLDAVTTSFPSPESEKSNSLGQIQTAGNNNNTANRAQILQHIYTRCQEELEKNVPPGMGLLNKLLRTEISSIRTNQLQYYLGPQVTSITSPDGKTIELNNNNGTGGKAKALVSHGEFIDALSQAVSQIRTLEKSGGTDRLSAMNLIENIRRVAMEARVVLVDSYGEESEVVSEFQRDLQPVFRPSGSGKVESAT